MNDEWTRTVDALREGLGLHADAAHLTFLQMTLRAAVVFLWGVVLFRIGDRRSLGRNSGYDMLLIIILGSVLSRAVNGRAAFLPTLGVSGMLVLFHHVLGVLACRSDFFSRLVKGVPVMLVRNGRMDYGTMRRHGITIDDLEENLRMNGNVPTSAETKEARLERNGGISVVRKEE